MSFLTKINVSVLCIFFLLVFVCFLFWLFLELISKINNPEADIIQMVSEERLTYEFTKIQLSVWHLPLAVSLSVRWVGYQRQTWRGFWMANLCYQMAPTRCWSERLEFTLCSLILSHKMMPELILALPLIEQDKIHLLWSWLL